jgi:hypothetical protein
VWALTGAGRAVRCLPLTRLLPRDAYPSCVQRLGRPEEEDDEDEDDSDEEDDYDEEEPSGAAGLLSFPLSRPLSAHVLPLAQSARRRAPGGTPDWAPAPAPQAFPGALTP